MSKINLNINFICEIEKLNKLDKQLFLLTLEMLENDDTLGIDNLGQRQLELIGNLFVNAYISKKISQTENDSLTQSTIVYNNFVEWCKENKICDKLFDYFTQTRFTQLFGQRFTQKRTAEGKFWKNIIIKENTNKQSIPERLCSIYNSIFGLTFRTTITDIENTNEQSNYLEQSTECENDVLDIEESIPIITNEPSLGCLDIVDFCNKNNYKLKYVNYVDGELIFDIINTNLNENLKMKIVPYKNNHIVNSLDYLNDKNIPENYQATIHKLLNNFVILHQTPHINLHIAQYYTKLSSFTNLDADNVVRENDDRYKNFTTMYNKGDFCENALVLISEYCDKGDLLDFIRNNYKNFTPIHWKVFFFQIISTLSTIQSKYPSFRHNNLKSNELFVTKIVKKNNTFEYRVQKKTYIVPNIGYQIKFDNFDFANVNDIVCNPKLDLSWVKAIPIAKTQNRYYDMHFFFNTLIQIGFVTTGFMNDNDIPTEVKEFIKRIVPDKYRGLKKETVTNRGRLVADDEYLLPDDVLKHDKYFAEFR